MACCTSSSSGLSGGVAGKDAGGVLLEAHTVSLLQLQGGVQSQVRGLRGQELQQGARPAPHFRLSRQQAGHLL